MASGEGKRLFSRMVYVSDEDAAALDDIDAMGIEIEVQEVPSTTAQSYKHLREKF